MPILDATKPKNTAKTNTSDTSTTRLFYHKTVRDNTDSKPLTLSTIAQRAAKPPIVKKKLDGAAFSLCSASAEEGNFTDLVFDIDTGNHTLDRLKDVIGSDNCLIYTTHSATEKDAKYRLILPLKQPLNKNQHVIATKVVNEFFGDYGIKIDKSNLNQKQKNLLPIKATQDAYYQYHIQLDGKNFDAHKSLGCHFEAELKKQISKPSNNNNTINLFNESHGLDWLKCYLETHDWTFKTSAKGYIGNNPNSTNKTFGCYLMADNGVSFYTTQSTSSPLYMDNLKALDSFEVFKQLEHKGDLSKALQDASDNYITVDGVPLTQHKQDQYKVKNRTKYDVEQGNLIGSATAKDDLQAVPAKNCKREIDHQLGQKLMDQDETEAIEKIEVSEMNNKFNDDTEILATEHFKLDDVDLYKPKNKLLRLIMEEIHLTAKRTLPISYILSALQCLAMAASKNKIKGIENCKLNILTILIAPSGSGKNAGLSFIKKVAKKLEIDIFSDPRSDKDLIFNALYKDGLTPYVIDEAHGLLNAITSKNAQSYQLLIAKQILHMFTDEDLTITGTHRRELIKELRANEKDGKLTKDEEQLKNLLKNPHTKLEPYINIMMCSTPEMFDKVVNSTTANNGLIGRSILLRTDEISERKKGTSNETNFNEIISHLEKIRDSSANVKATPEALALYEEIVIYFDSEKFREHYFLRSLFVRLPERVACIASLLGLHDVITLDDVKYALKLMLKSLSTCNHLLALDEVHTPEDKIDLIISRIFDFLSKKPMCKSTLEQKVLKDKRIYGAKNQFNEALERLEQSKDIKIEGRKVVLSR